LRSIFQAPSGTDISQPAPSQLFTHVGPAKTLLDTNAEPFQTLSSLPVPQTRSTPQSVNVN